MMTPIQTPLTNLLGIKTPVISAPMAGASGGALAAQVTLGGGFGFLAAGYDAPHQFKRELSISRDMLPSADFDILRIGVGFLVWQLEQNPSVSEELISIAMDYHVQAVWLAFGEDIGSWIRRIRSLDRHAGSENFVKIFVQVSTVEQALQAVNEWKADVIVVQGNEAGGHGLGTSLPLLTLFPILSETVTNASAATKCPPLIAAGGVAVGSQVAALLTLGASGVAIGTRFLLSPESLYSDPQRHALIEADSSHSVRTMAFDHVRNTMGWPKDVDGRALRNDTVIDFDNGVDLTTIRTKFAKSVECGEKSRMLVWAGSGVGLMRSIMPAKEIVRELHDDSLERLARSKTMASHLF